MPQAVRFDRYGGVDVLDVVEVDAPSAGEGQVVVRVQAAGINPGEAAIREGALHERWPATFPSGQGSDLAGVVTEVGPGVEGVAVGDEVIGYTDNRASHAELVVVEAEHLDPAARARSRGRWPVRCTSWARPRTPRCARSTSARATPSRCRAPPAGSGRSPCSSRAKRAQRSSDWPARTTTTGCATTA